jgi:hypothetical protein
VRRAGHDDVATWSSAIVTTYVGGRSLEKIARTIWRRARAPRDPWWLDLFCAVAGFANRPFCDAQHGG